MAGANLFKGLHRQQKLLKTL